ncbi:hypothetical protein C7M84_021634 [Penaeus vannamei]|uniref:Uncharacterized protein n=1 Tax=Penaeus vannamei TaxID=6689 RepID=A0A3R7P427_PENVA|nr:hypothetical protein C7M84_021634 [Penaeus vannamei]
MAVTHPPLSLPPPPCASPGGDALVCPKGFFNCTDACIRDIFRCDGEVDCAAAEDEAECDECQSGALQCRGGSCVGAPRVCDGVRDCADGDDEDDCPANNSTALCPAGYLSCDNGTCYNGRFRCDGKMHCNDTTDEEDCYTELVTPEIHKARLRCSQYYRDLVEYLAMPEVANASLGDGQVECQHFKNGTFPETSFDSPMCLTIVICDYYGCYSEDLMRLDEYGFGKLSNDSLSLMLKKGELPDFTDIADLHASSREERLNNSVPAEDIVYSCTFDNHRCNHTQFFTWMSDEYGTCYTFNSFFQGNDSKVKTTKRAGPKTGLKVALEIRKGVALLTPEVGVRVVVHDPRLLPALEEEGFSIGPGVSSVAVKRTKYERLGNPHGVCANDYGFDHPYMYSRKLCKQLCIERVFREQCRCFIGQNPLYDSLETKPERQCSSNDRVQGLCMANVSKSIEEESIQCDCPLPCSEMTYDAQVTTSKPNNLYYNILSDTRKELKSLCSNDTQMVSLLVYLDSKSYGWDTLLSNIGGSLGLFIGVSLISILEMIEMIIDFVLIGFRRCTGRGKKISQMSATGETLRLRY